MSKFVVGKDVDSWCTKCLLMLAHTIESVVGEKITKVHCNTCNARHAYRPNPPGQTKKRSSSPRSRSGAAAPERDYATLIRDKDPSKARPYSMGERFRPSEVIQHPSFGLGVVTAARDQKKIEVLFQDGSRVLVHGHP